MDGQWLTYDEGRKYLRRCMAGWDTAEHEIEIDGLHGVAFKVYPHTGVAWKVYPREECPKKKCYELRFRENGRACDDYFMLVDKCCTSRRETGHPLTYQWM